MHQHFNLDKIKKLNWKNQAMNKLIPKNSRRVIRKKYEDSAAWHMFARKICKNSFVKEHLRKRDGNFCGWCGFGHTSEPIIHHLDYDHICTYNRLVRINKPTRNRVDRTVEVPDCENCVKENLKGFESCMERIRLVHAHCNMEIAIFMRDRNSKKKPASEQNRQV